MPLRLSLGALIIYTVVYLLATIIYVLHIFFIKYYFPLAPDSSFTSVLDYAIMKVHQTKGNTMTTTEQLHAAMCNIATTLGDFFTAAVHIMTALLDAIASNPTLTVVCGICVLYYIYCKYK